MDNVKAFIHEVLHKGGLGLGIVDLLEVFAENPDIAAIDWKLYVSVTVLAVARVLRENLTAS